MSDPLLDDIVSRVRKAWGESNISTESFQCHTKSLDKRPDN